MQAMVIREHGGPEVIVPAEVPTPVAGAGQVRVRVRAVALNHLDVWVRRGGPAFKLEYPHRLGSDIAGELDDGSKVVVQPGVSCGRCAACLGGHDNLCRDYKILGENTQGGYGEYVVVPSVNVAPMPASQSFVEAAASLLPFLTAWQMVVHKARVQPGDTVLVHGLGSGVGSAAVQIAKLFGARVLATAGTPEKVARGAALGVDVAIDYTKDDFAAIARAETGKRGVDVVIEHVGGKVFEQSIRAVRNGGRIVTCGATAGFHPAIDLRQIFFRQVEVLGSTMGSKADLLAVLAHVGAGRLRPVIDRVLPLAAAPEGHRILEDRAAFGRVVMEVA